MDVSFDNVTWFSYPTEIIWWQIGGYLLAIAWAGFVIGCFGVGGGVVKMPLALMLPGMTPTVAAGCIFAGAFPMAICRNVQLMYFGHLTIWKAMPLMSGGILGALLGQLALPHLPREVVGLLVAALAIWAGVQTHRKVMRELRAKRAEKEQERKVAAVCPGGREGQAAGPAETGKAVGKAFDDQEEVQEGPALVTIATQTEEHGFGAEPPLKASQDGRSPVFSLEQSAPAGQQRLLQILCQAALGLVASFLSSISGTGGPAIFFPLGMLMDPQAGMRTLVAMSAPFAMVMTSFSALGALFFGQIDVGLSLLMALVGIVFSQLGGLLMERMGDTKLKAGVGAVLVLVGLSLAVKVIVELAT